MKLLLDSCLSSVLIEPLTASGHLVAWVGNWPDGDPGDVRVLDAAIADSSVLVTLDRDCGELAVLRGTKHTGIVRLVDIRVRDQAARCIEVFAAHETDLVAGAIITVEPTRIRVRPAQ